MEGSGILFKFGKPKKGWTNLPHFITPIYGQIVDQYPTSGEAIEHAGLNYQVQNRDAFTFFDSIVGFDPVINIVWVLKPIADICNESLEEEIEIKNLPFSSHIMPVLASIKYNVANGIAALVFFPAITLCNFIAWHQDLGQ